MTFPLFINMKFNGDNPTPLSEVSQVALSYMTANGMATPTLFEMGTENDPELWKKIAEWIAAFAQQTRSTVMPVGWNVRNLLWPALVANLARENLVSVLPTNLLQQKEKRWSNVDMVDVSNLIMQGGYIQEPLKFEDACWFFLGDAFGDEGTAADRLWKIYDIYAKYV